MEQQTNIEEARQRVEASLAWVSELSPFWRVPVCFWRGHKRARPYSGLDDICTGCGEPWAELYPPNPKA